MIQFDKDILFKITLKDGEFNRFHYTKGLGIINHISFSELNEKNCFTIDIWPQPKSCLIEFIKRDRIKRRIKSKLMIFLEAN
jgi:hypothetical protein